MRHIWIAETEQLHEAPLIRAFYDRERAVIWAVNQFKQHDQNDNPRIMQYEDSVIVASVKYYDLLATITRVYMAED